MQYERGPIPIQYIEHVWIPTRNGTLLSARIWRPVNDSAAVPAVVDCHPYRVSDSSAVNDSRWCPWLASHGYACVRVDLRGSGNSQGVLLDEYLSTEIDDNCDVVEWVAEQPWCSGSVGYIGISWSGFAGLQLAARRPQALKAVISICASDDRYSDDVHYRGGAVLANDMLPWASMMLMLNGLPPDPAIVGNAWRPMWHDRLEHSPPFIENWLRHRVRDAYWQHGSVCEDYDAIKVPVLAVGGWNDGYVDAVFRLLANLTSPVRGLIGPWSHGSPEQTGPGPTIGFLQEALRWWDHWLKGLPTTVATEPPLRAWLQRYATPAVMHLDRPGDWVAWSPDEPHSLASLALSDGTLIDAGQEREQRVTTIATSQALGLDAGAWCPAGLPGDWPGDQRRDDGEATTYTSAPLTEAVAVLGVPYVVLAVASSHSSGNVVVRLCDVAPDGTSLLVSRGVLDLTHRSSHEFPEALVPGESIEVRVPLKATGHLFECGHRVRVSIHPTYWPWVWPVADNVTLTITEGARSRLYLPLIDLDSSIISPDFAAPVQSEPLSTEQLRAGSLSRVIQRDVITGEHELEIVRVAPTVRLTSTEIEMGFEDRSVFRIVEGNPLSASVRCENRAFRRRSGWNVSVHTVSEMTCSDREYLLDLSLSAFEGDTQVHARTWQFRVPR